MSDPIASPVDGTLLLPNEQMTPNNLAALKGYSGLIDQTLSYMQTVFQAVYNYEKGYTQKIVLNPADIQTYIGNIRTVTVNIAGGYDVDGATLVTAKAANIPPDLLMTLRNHQLYLCQLYAVYVDSQGQVVGPLDTVTIEDTTTTGGVLV